ncbi:receptor-like protein 44 [Diospyros lotus]|uniref:receptor-like protein 44 n=1 Tax=Diospyros lotus TaxID=55363 RepID=UPI00224E2CDA|nr:receptor-like protein 44 [Diospyros lotus]XP_052204222.1 receptor-like protein 44 [Diospyros lotus]XP_052204223.1 receptor-like protein 44 [Diospyros lotus]
MGQSSKSSRFSSLANVRPATVAQDNRRLPRWVGWAPCPWAGEVMGGGVWALLSLVLLTWAGLQQPSAADPDDEACLTYLSESMEDPNKRLQNWTRATFKEPCSGFTSYLQGATCNNGRIYKLSLSNLSLRGSISPFLSNCTNLQALDLSSNALSGPIPAALHSLLNLAVLNLSANRLSGDIPPQLALCAYLNVIDLHDNLLSGAIPPQLGLLARLSVFDVSNNRLAGPIPPSLGNRSGNLPRFNASSYAGNKDLYGYPLPPLKNRGLSVLAIVGIGLGSGFMSLLLSFTAVCLWLRASEQKRATEEAKMSQFMPDY